jgi:hypothetical protein
MQFLSFLLVNFEILILHERWECTPELGCGSISRRKFHKIKIMYRVGAGYGDENISFMKIYPAEKIKK